jgi:hypothetical protein
MSLIYILRKWSRIALVDFVSTGVLKTVTTLWGSAEFGESGGLLRMMVNLDVELVSSRKVKMLQVYTIQELWKRDETVAGKQETELTIK